MTTIKIKNYSNEATEWIKRCEKGPSHDAWRTDSFLCLCVNNQKPNSK